MQCRVAKVMALTCAVAFSCATASRLEAQATDPFSGEIVGNQWLALGPFASPLGCNSAEEQYTGNHVAPSVLFCQYPEAGDAVDYDPALTATTTGLHIASPADGDGNPTWYEFDDGSPTDGDLNFDGTPAGDVSDHVLFIATYVEYAGDDPLEVDLCIRRDDNAVIWFDNEIVHNVVGCQGRGAAGECQVLSPVTVEPGVHRILVGVWERAGGWGMALRLIDQLSGATIDDTHPDFFYLGTDPAGIEVECTTPTSRSITTLGAIDLASCPPANEGPVEVTLIKPLGPDDSAGDEISVMDCLTGADAADVSAPGGTVTASADGACIAYTTTRGELADPGLVYTVDPDGLTTLTFDGEAAGATIGGTATISLGTVREQFGPIDDPSFDFAHGIGPLCEGTFIDSPADGEIIVAGAGEDIWQNGDTFMYAYSEVEGDFSARVTITDRQFPAGSRWGKHGIMARQDCSDRSRYSFMHDQGEDLQDASRFATRPTHGGNDNFETTGPLPAGSHYDNLRLDRVGNEFIGFVFDELGDAGFPGEWVEVGRADWGPDAPEAVQLGLAVTSHNGCNVTTITFEDWEVTDDVDCQPVQNLVCSGRSDGGVDLNWESPGGDCSGDISISLNGEVIQDGIAASATSATVPADELEDGVNTLTVTNEGGSRVCAYFSGDELYVNCGGQRLDDELLTGLGDDRVWLEDTTANPSPFLASANANTATFAIPIDTQLVEPDFTDSPDGTVLFGTERWADGPVNYRFALPEACYEVTLLFAEGCCSEGCEDTDDPLGVGDPCRVFNVHVNDQIVEENFSQHITAQRALGGILPNADWGVAVAMGPYTVTGSLVDVLIEDLGPGGNPQNASIKGICVVRVGSADNCEGGGSGRFVRGDSNSDGSINLNDGIVSLNWLFQGGPEPNCLDAADVDNNGQVLINDAISTFGWLFLGAVAPSPPTPTVAAGYPASDCGPDPEGGNLGCIDPAATCS